MPRIYETAARQHIVMPGNRVKRLALAVAACVALAVYGAREMLA